jgi:dTDP-4-dehydrorhamnose 3,5-epimerase
MRVEALALPGVRLIHPDRHEDERGFFSETYRRDTLATCGIDDEFVQDNHSGSARAGTIRGLHFQIGPFAQVKLVRVSRGAVYDVVVDIRHGSPTFGRHVAVRLDAKAGTQIYVPIGYAHGLCTLEDDTEVQYKVSALYSADHDRGLLWNDPALGIEWPVDADSAVVSGRDADHPVLAKLPRYFALDA